MRHKVLGPSGIVKCNNLPMFRQLIQTVMGSLAFKLGAAFVLVVLVAVGGMGASAYFWVQRSTVQHELDNLRILSSELGARINLSLATSRGLANHLAHTRDVQDFLNEKRGGMKAQGAIQEWLDLQLGGTRGLSAVFILSPKGTIIASSDRSFVGADVSFRPYFQQAMSGDQAISDWVIGSVTRTPRIFSAAPVRHQRRITGVLVTEFLVDEVEAAIRSIGVKGRTAMVFNSKGIALSHSNPTLQYRALTPLDAGERAELKLTRQFLDREISVEPTSAEFIAAFKRVRDASQSQTLKYKVGDTSNWCTLTPLVEQPWVVAVAIPEAEILLPIHQALKNILLVGLTTTLGVFLLALALGRSLLHPIHRLSDAMGRFGAGDTKVRAPILAQDERGRVAQEFNSMADALQTYQEHLEDLVKTRTLDLEQSLAEVRTLQGIIPICSYCKQIRDEAGGWWQMERYISDHSDAAFSHGICPECKGRVFPDSKGHSIQA